MTSTFRSLPGERIIGLDILRSVAIFLVLGRHWPWTQPNNIQWGAACLNLWHRIGWVGVDLFFVLSGYLVSGLLFQEYNRTGSVRISRFLIRRGFKIYPHFYAMLLCTTAVELWQGAFPSKKALLCEMLYLQNYGPSLWGHTWSIAVEEHFYLLLALIAYTLLHFRNRTGLSAFVFFASLFAIAVLSLRLLHIQVHPEIGFKSHITPTHFRIDSLFAGVVLSYFINNHSVSSVATITRWRRTLLLMGCVLLSVNAFFELESSAFAVTYGFTANYIGAAAIVAVMGTQQLPRNSITLSIGRIGEYSYGVYLWHFPVLVWCGKALSAESHFNTDYSFQWSVFWLFLYILASLLCGVIMTFFIEKPFLRVRARICR